MCGCKDCKGITLLKGTDGKGIVSITDNEDGTFTFLYTDGTTYITPDLTGPQGDPGDPGTDGTDGTDGADGTNGTNAYKFTKQFFMQEGDTVTISRSILLACADIPEGCLAAGTFPSLFDFHVQIWVNNAEIVSDFWDLDNSGFTITVNAVTGLLTIIRLGGIDLNVRVVILA